VVNVELVVQEALELLPPAMAVVSRSDEDMGRQGGKAGGHLPDVEVVDLEDPRQRGHRAPDALGLEPLGRGLEQDAARVTQEPVGGADHDRGHEQSGDAVGADEAGQEDDRASDRGAGEGEQVGEEVLEGALDVEALAVGTSQRPGRGKVDGHADERDDEDGGTLDLGWVDEPADALVDDEHG